MCREIPGFSEDYVTALGVSKDWLLTDCDDGASGYMRIVDKTSGADIFELMIRYREGILDAGVQPKFKAITHHMQAAGARASHFNYVPTLENL